MKQTKGKLLSAGARLVWQKGFNNTGLQEILKEAGVPKGSFYFYFDSKESFGLELIDVYISFFERELDGIMLDTSKNGLVRIKAFLDFFKMVLEKENYTGVALSAILPWKWVISMRDLQKEYHKDSKR